LAKQGIAHLPLYNDATGEATIQLMASRLPLTVVVNKEGKEIARVRRIGTAPEWSRRSKL
jgi:hypothetical protein